MTHIILVERVMCQRIDIRILHTYIHYLMGKAEREVATHAEVARLGSITQRQLIRRYQCCNLIGILFAKHIRHALVVAHSGARVELEHLLAEWSVRHKVCTDIPWYHIRIHGLEIAFTRLIVNRIVNQCILGECSTQSCHDARELLLIETRVHGKNIMIERRIQSQITYSLVHRIGVITYRFHLLDSRLTHTTTIVDTRKLFATELIFEVHIR